MPFILKQVGGNVKVTDTNGENLGYFDRSQIECNFNPLDKTVSVTMIGNTVVTLPPVTPGGVLTINTTTGGAVDITSEALFDTNYALLFPELGGGSTTPVISGIFNATISGETNCTAEPVIFGGNVECFYIRAGDIVTVTGQVVVTCNAFQAFFFKLGNLPGVAAAFLDTESAAGTFNQIPDINNLAAPGYIPSSGIITADSSSPAVVLSGNTNDVNPLNWAFSFSYAIR